ncbi:tRNA lysidine(34) synthetase TilS, partial [Patescibacteria group bacterium]|nr:tRNA lysidine(34) synthetase TilS [Patescibacteria group bacterium]
QIKNIVKKYRLDKKISIIAVSGGVDSMALLKSLYAELPSKCLVVAHFNHNVRNDSILDERLVKRTSRKLGLEFISSLADGKRSDEASLRKIRYDWLNEIKEQTGAEYIITAHHLDDQLETVLLKLVRGAGPLEMWGMRELSGCILRPLLSVSKEDIIDYAKEHHLLYRNDLSNKDVLYARNRIRLNVIPELEKINPLIKKTILPNIKLAGELRGYVDAEASKLEKIARHDNKLKLTVLKKADPFLVKVLIRRVLGDQLGSKREIYSKNIDQILSLLDKSGTKRTSIMGLLITKDYEWLAFGNDETSNAEETGLLLDKELTFYNFKFRTYLGVADATVNNILLPVEFSDNLKVRAWEKGDKIKTASGTKKLQDIFVDAKISQSDRKRWPLVIRGNQILWVPKLAASSDAGRSNKNLIIEVE